MLKPFITLLALVLVLEEWLWDTLKAQLHRISHLPGVRRVEQWLGHLPPWASVLVLLTPGLVLIPFKLAGLWALAHGHPGLGVLVLVLAKLTGTALVAYLLDLVRERARQVPWFNWVYEAIMGLLARAKAWLAAQPAYMAARHAVTTWKLRMQAQWAHNTRRSAWVRRLHRVKRLLRKR